MARMYTEHEIPLEATAFWELLHTEAYEQFQARELGLKEYEEVDRRQEGDTVIRRIRVAPDIHLPGPVRKFVDRHFGDEEISYIEAREERDGELAYTWWVEAPVMADKINVGGRFYVEPIDDDRCRRVLDGEAKIKAFGVGSIVERLAVQETIRTYDRIPEIVRKWKREQAG